MGEVKCPLPSTRSLSPKGTGNQCVVRSADSTRFATPDDSDPGHRDRWVGSGELGQGRGPTPRDEENQNDPRKALTGTSVGVQSTRGPRSMSRRGGGWGTRTRGPGRETGVETVNERTGVPDYESGVCLETEGTGQKD